MNKSLKLLSGFVASVLFIGFLATSVHAEDQKAVNGVTVEPSKIVMQINDYGKVYTFTITNTTGAKINLTASEGLVTQNEDGTTAPLNEEVKKSFIEILNNKVTIEDGKTAEIKVRTKIVGNDTTAKFPAMVLKSSDNASAGIGIAYELYIPIIAQNTSGKLSMASEMKIDVENYSFTPNVTVSGTVTNDGDKFYTPSGTIVILKDGVKIQEQEISSQIAEILMPGKTRQFNYTWTNPKQSYDGVGEYTVETRITNNQSEKIVGSRIKYIYVPMQLVYIVAGAVGGIVLLVIVINVVKTIVKKNRKPKVQNY